MKCDSIHSNIIFYLDGELPPEETAAIKKHLNECSTCSKLFSEISKTYKLAESVPPLSGDFTSSVMEKVKTEVKADPYTRQFVTFTRRIAAAVLLMLVGFSITVILAQRPANGLSREDTNQQEFIDYYFADLETYDIESYYENQENK